MFLIQMDVQCTARFFEILPDLPENAACAVEDLVSQILLAHFDEVTMDEVTLEFVDRPLPEQAYCFIHLEASCSRKSSSLSLSELELVVEERSCFALIELFGTVSVERIAISSSQHERVAP